MFCVFQTFRYASINKYKCQQIEVFFLDIIYVFLERQKCFADVFSLHSEWFYSLQTGLFYLTRIKYLINVELTSKQYLGVLLI